MNIKLCKTGKLVTKISNLISATMHLNLVLYQKMFQRYEAFYSFLLFSQVIVHFHFVKKPDRSSMWCLVLISLIVMNLDSLTRLRTKAIKVGERAQWSEVRIVWYGMVWYGMVFSNCGSAGVGRDAARTI